MILHGNTIQRASYLFSRWVLVPRLEMFRALLQERLAPQYDDRLVVGYVSPVEDDREFRLEVGRSAPWSLTVDEWRALGDAEPLESGGGERYMVPAGLEPRVDFEVSEVPETPPAPVPETEPSAPVEVQHLARLSKAELLDLRAIVTKMGCDAAGR